MSNGNGVQKQVCGVIVTRNRLALLVECVVAVRRQSFQPGRIIVVNNDSNDGTADWLSRQKDLTVLSQANLGGAGGFHRGIKEAYVYGAEWIWCMDDDTIPEADALQALLHSKPAEDGDCGWLCSVVRWKDGALHQMNIPQLLGDESRQLEMVDIKSGNPVPARFCSLVSVLVHRRAVLRCGLPLRQYFIWLDDVEYTSRIARSGLRGWCIPISKVLHATSSNSSPYLEGLNDSNAWKFGYFFRNHFSRMSLEGVSGVRFLKAAMRDGLRFAAAAWRQCSLPVAAKLWLRIIHGIFFFRPKIEFIKETCSNHVFRESALQ